MSGLIRALRAAREKFWSALYFDDWTERRDIFAADDLFDRAWNERPDDRAVIESAAGLVGTMMRELNDREATS